MHNPPPAKKTSGCWKKKTAWLKTQLFGRASRKTVLKERHPDQACLFNEAGAPVGVMVPVHEHGKSLCATLSWVMVIVHEFSEEQICAADGAQLTRNGEEISKRLDEIIAVKP
jgi:hypothetical protein